MPTMPDMNRLVIPMMAFCLIFICLMSRALWAIPMLEMTNDRNI